MLQIETIEGMRLAGNLLGNETARPLVIHLPDGYSASSARRYPTVYLLHGYGSRAMYWPYGPALASGSMKPPIEQVVANAVARYKAKDVILVMPDGWSKFGCSQWIDSPVTGNFEQHVLHDVVPYVDRNYRTLPEAASRGIMGISSGGFGAWHLCSRNPGVFGAAVLLSADSFFEITHKPFFHQFYNRIYPSAPNGPIEGDVISYMCYGLSQAYTPNVNNPPFYTDFAVEFPSGDVIDELWQKWLALDPVVSWEPRLDNLRQLQGLLLDAGRNDEFDLHYGHRILSKHLAGAGVRHDVEEHDGTHTSLLFDRIEFALGWFSDVLAFEAASPTHTR
jgi:enterochelin esterase family protein